MSANTTIDKAAWISAFEDDVLDNSKKLLIRLVNDTHSVVIVDCPLAPAPVNSLSEAVFICKKLRSVFDANNLSLKDARDIAYALIASEKPVVLRSSLSFVQASLLRNKLRNAGFTTALYVDKPGTRRDIDVAALRSKIIRTIFEDTPCLTVSDALLILEALL